jgi:hypothetical protein
MEKNVEIFKTLNCLVKLLADALIRDYDDFPDELLKSYNFYQEEERDGANYIFDITNKKEVMETDLPMSEIVKLYCEEGLPFFLCNANGVRKFHKVQELKSQILGFIVEIAEHIICYHEHCESHKYLYDRYICDAIINNK